MYSVVIDSVSGFF